MKRSKYAQILLYLALNAFISPCMAKIKVKKELYGRSFEGKGLYIYKVFNDNALTNTNFFLITEGLHGNEYQGLSLDLIKSDHYKALSKSSMLYKYLESGGTLYIAPKINPDAIESKARFAPSGHDLNRDFETDLLHAQESYMFSKWLDKEFSKKTDSLRISVDLHCCGGALLKAKNNKLKINTIKTTQQGQNTFIPITTTQNLFSKTFNGTLKDFLSTSYQFEAFTYENKNMSKNKLNIVSLIENLLLEYQKV